MCVASMEVIVISSSDEEEDLGSDFDVSGDTLHNTSLLVEESCMDHPGDYVVPDMDDASDAHESLDVISETLLESPTDYSNDTSNAASLVGTNCTSRVWQTGTDQANLSEMSESSLLTILLRFAW